MALAGCAAPPGPDDVLGFGAVLPAGFDPRQGHAPVRGWLPRRCRPAA